MKVGWTNVIIHFLNLSQGFYIGTWKLSGLTVQVSNLLDPSNPTARYSFQMTLTLRSRPLGRWNKLEFDEYESINLEDGEATALGLKNERPFWFSKVRSYSSSRIE
jgi:F-box protein 9